MFGLRVIMINILTHPRGKSMGWKRNEKRIGKGVATHGAGP